MKLRLAQNKDLKFIFNLYNQNILEKNFFSKKKVHFNEHKDWFKKSIREKKFFICLLKDKIGYVRFNEIDKKNLTVSIAVKKKYKRKGYGRFGHGLPKSSISQTKSFSVYTKNEEDNKWKLNRKN